MDKITKAMKDSLNGHPSAKEIMEVLQSPTEPREMQERRQGYTVELEDWERLPDAGSETQLFSVKLLKHWRGGFCPEGFGAHNERQRELRAWHDLGFTLRPNRHGRYKKITPSVRRKCLAAYKLQTEG